MKEGKTKTLKEEVSEKGENANARQEGLTWKSTLLGGIAGAVISGLVLFLAYKNQVDMASATAMAGAAPTGDLMVELLTLAGIFAGGFIAAFMAKGGKESFSKCVVASFFSGLIVGSAVLVIQFLQLQTLIESAGQDGEAVMLYVLVMTVLIAAVITALSVIGGIVCALLTGSRESVLIEVFKETKKSASLGIVLPALVFLLAAVGFQLLITPVIEQKFNDMTLAATDTTQLLIAAAVIAIVLLAIDVLFLSFALAAAIGGMRKDRQGLAQAFKDSVKECKHVFVATLVFLLVTPFALLFVLPYLQLSVIWVLAILGIYFLFVSFIAPIAFIKKEYVHCAKHSFEFVKDNFLMTIAFYSILFVVASVMVTASVLALSYWPDETVTAVVSTIVFALVLVLVSSSQTVFYSSMAEAKK